MNASAYDVTRTKLTRIGPIADDVSPAHGDNRGYRREDEHTPSPYSNMLRSLAFQARLYRLCGCLFVKDMLAKAPRSPKVIWVHWYSLYAAACFIFYLWFEIDIVTRSPIVLGDTYRFFTKSLLVILNVVIILNACSNFLTMVFSCRKILDFFLKAARFEKEISIPTCKCCSQRHFLLSDLSTAMMFVVYFAGYMMALFYQEQKVDVDDVLNVQEIVDRVCCIFAAVLFFVYDSANMLTLRHSADVLERYVTFLKQQLEEYAGDNCLQCEMAAKKVQATRIQLTTVLELKNDINGIWQKSIVVSSIGILLVTCISLYTVITQGMKSTEIWIAIGYSAFASYEFFRLANVSQSLASAVQNIKNLCRRTLTLDRTVAYNVQ
uniref:Gustatory receptor n=1 Tax=Amblyomma maculatum TaxID=34609 RepID=G3MRZ8_AMBMU